MVKKIFFVLGVFLIITGLAFAEEAKKEPVVWGCINSLTGKMATLGVDDQTGEMIAVDEVNAAGGVLGRPLKIIYEDNESRPEVALELAHKLIDVHKVPLIIASDGSAIVLAACGYANKKQVIGLSGGATSPKLREIGPYYFAMIALDDIMGKEVAKFAMEDSGAKTFGIIGADHPFCIGMEINEQKYVEENGGKVVSIIRYQVGKTDYRAELDRLFGPKPEIILMAAFEEGALIMKQAYELGYKPSKGWYGGYPDMWATYATHPETIEGLKGLLAGAVPPLDYIEAYKAKVGHDPTTEFGGYDYDAIWIAAIATNFAGTTDPDVVKNIIPLVAKRYKGITGDKTMDEDGMQVREEYRQVIYHNGKPVPYK